MERKRVEGSDGQRREGKKSTHEKMRREGRGGEADEDRGMGTRQRQRRKTGERRGGERSRAVRTGPGECPSRSHLPALPASKPPVLAAP